MNSEAKIEFFGPVDYPLVVDPLIFLGGPIQGGPDWQAQAISFIRSLVPDDRGLFIANPRRKYLGPDFDWDKQTDWERFYIKTACRKGVVMFWLPAEVEHDPQREYGQTSRVELTEVAVNRNYHPNIRLVVGIDGFFGARYLMNKMLPDNCPDLQVCTSLVQTCQKAVEQIFDLT